jgi:small subunit ribosomal protein S11
MTEEKSSVEGVVAERAPEGAAASAAKESSKRARAPKAKAADKKVPEGAQKSENKPEVPQAEKAEKETAESLLKEGLEENLKIKRAKGSKNVTTGVCHIAATFNNTKVVFSDVKGNVLSWSSAGRCGFKGSRKSTAYAGQVATTEAAKVAMGHGLRDVFVEVKGPGMGRDAAIRTLQTVGLSVSAIKDVTPIPHGGCRPKKRRRV